MFIVLVDLFNGFECSSYNWMMKLKLIGIAIEPGNDEMVVVSFCVRHFCLSVLSMGH